MRLHAVFVHGASEIESYSWGAGGRTLDSGSKGQRVADYTTPHRSAQHARQDF